MITEVATLLSTVGKNTFGEKKYLLLFVFEKQKEEQSQYTFAVLKHFVILF